MPKMTETELLAELRSDLDQSISESTTLSSERADALRYYLGDEFGNEVEGRSRVITTEVSDTVEGALPPLLKLFTSSDDVALFDPVGPEDEEQALQESDYLNHVFYKDNPGFNILYNWFKDALLSKNGVVKYYWCDETEEKRESYEGLMVPQVEMLLADPDIEITGQEVETDEKTGETTFSLNVKRTNKKGRLEVVVIPPEKFHIHPEHNSVILDEVNFCAHESDVYRYELLEEGYDAEKVERIFSEAVNSEEVSARYSDIDEPDESNTDKVTIYECYKRVDYDGDGYPELRKITVGGDYTILENEEIDYIPFVSITPIPMTHRFTGRSYADITMDLQLIKSTLLRNIFDNLYLINNRRMGVVEGEVNMDDALDSRPGGIIRMTAPNMIFPVEQGAVPASAYQMLDVIDNIKENRTGITRYNQGLDANALNKTATGINKIMDASNERLLLVAKIFGDGLKRLFLGMHRLLLQNQDAQRIVKLRNKWVPVNPSEWKERTNMTINVGLGTNDKQQQLQSLQMIGMIQKEMMQAGLKHIVDDRKLYNTAKKLVEAAGFKHVQFFFDDPATKPPPEPPPPAPELQVQQMIAQAEMEKAKAQQMDVQRKAQADQQNFQLELEKIKLERLKLQLEAEKITMDGVLGSTREQNRKSADEARFTLDAAKASADTVIKVQENQTKQREAAKQRTFDVLKEGMKRDSTSRTQ